MLLLLKRKIIRCELPFYIRWDGRVAHWRDQRVVGAAVGEGGKVAAQDVGHGCEPDCIEDCGEGALGFEGGEDGGRGEGVVDDIGWAEGGDEISVAWRGCCGYRVAGCDGVSDREATAGARAAVDQDFFVGIVGVRCAGEGGEGEFQVDVQSGDDGAEVEDCGCCGGGGDGGGDFGAVVDCG